MCFFSLWSCLSAGVSARTPGVPVPPRPHSVGRPRLPFGGVKHGAPDATRAAPTRCHLRAAPGSRVAPTWARVWACDPEVAGRGCVRCRSAVRCRWARPGGAACRELRRPRPRSQRAEPGWRAVRAGAGLSSARGDSGARPGASGGGWRSAAPGDPPRHADPAAPAARRGE